ncbi:MAG: TonB-dependent receptor [Prevotella sp.]|nr:TonB-dependent receptor [Prevotella sp.]
MTRGYSILLFLLVGIIAVDAQVEGVELQDTLREVLVKSQASNRRLNDMPIGAEKIDVETMSQLPAMFGERDIIKSMQLLPGVKGEGDGLGGYQVRGGTSAQNHILLDGASVYNVGHLMGLFSSFNDDAIGSVELFKGLMSARYGGGTSSVLTMNTRAGDPEHHHFSTTLGLLSAKIEADGPMGKNGSYLVAGRTSYLDLFIKASGKYSDNSLNFYDANVRLNFKLSPDDQLYFTFFRGHDGMKVEKLINMSWSNTIGSLGWLHTASPRRYMHTQLVASNYGTDQGMDVYSFNLSMEGFNRQLTLRHHQTWTPNKMHSINVGGESTLIGVKSASWRIINTRECEKREGWFASLWASDDMSFFNDRLQLSAGLRCEWISALGGKPYYTFSENGDIQDTLQFKKGSIVKTYTCLQPRLSVLWKMSSQVSFKAGYSRLAQMVQPIRNSSMSLPIDRLAMTSNYVKPLISDQVAAGFSVMAEDGSWDFSTDGYWKRLKNVYDFREGMTFNSEIELERLIVGGRGRAYGLEFAAHKNKGRTTGWVAYTLSWVQNQIDGIQNGDWYTAPNDRRHDFVVVLMSKLSPSWMFSSTWRYTTGQAMTAPSGKYEINGETRYYFGDRNQNRAPDFHRLDLSVAHTTTKGKATRVWTFGLFNAYCRYNPFFITFKDDDSKPSGTKAVVTSLFGIVPTVSFTYKY